jgi:hypothetical protein
LLSNVVVNLDKKNTRMELIKTSNSREKKNIIIGNIKYIEFLKI